ncbi:zf-DHHC-domain-containing protein [Microthyrium microscopicum]|uniref:Palmitoyltransferase n=1 Tax=Microthyrium microscopicum TaxID=703497 RepID=A0A6A6UG06_9PEZI|nr:zf-DHHC-domain-containing protein [Microthyrium microscopicum]
MGYRALAVAILAISFFTFVAFFGRLPGLRRTPIGLLHRVIWVYIPNGLRGVDKSISGGRISRSFQRGYQKLLFEKHPIVLIFFLSLITACAGLFLPAAWQYLPIYHKLGIVVLLPLPYIFTRLCNITNASSPHIVNHTNVINNLTQYPYDYKLFHPNNICRTCDLPKPARSKHCSLCRACVARADHHCIWVNNCLGRGNYKYFLSLLLSTSILLAYGAYLAYVTLKPQVAENIRQYPEWHVLEYANRTDYTGRMLCFGEWVLDVLATAFMLGGVSLGGVGFLAFLTAPLPAGLLSYHVYLIWAGMTTNESGKWGDWKEDMADGLCFITDFDTRDSWSYPSLDNNHYHPDVWKAGGWPKRSGQFLVLTGDGQHPRNLQQSIKDVVGDAEWRRVWNLKEVENVYDLGWWENAKDLLTN